MDDRETNPQQTEGLAKWRWSNLPGLWKKIKEVNEETNK